MREEIVRRSPNGCHHYLTAEVTADMTTMSRHQAYAELGLSPGATDDQIISAYRRLAKMTHPDVSHSPDSAESFSRITVAYRRSRNVDHK